MRTTRLASIAVILAIVLTSCGDSATDPSSETGASRSTENRRQAGESLWDTTPIAQSMTCLPQAELEAVVGFQLRHLASPPVDTPISLSCVASSLPITSDDMPDVHVIYWGQSLQDPATSLADVMQGNGVLFTISVSDPDTSAQIPTTPGTADGYGVYEPINVNGERGVVQNFDDGLNLAGWWATDSTGRRAKIILQSRRSFAELTAMAQEFVE